MSTHLEMVQRVLKDKGTNEFTLLKISSTSFVDPLYPSKGPVKVIEEYPVRSFRGSLNAYEIKQGLSKVGDIILYVDPTDVPEITTADQLEDSSGVIWNIVGKNTEGNMGVQTFHVRDEIVLYILKLRQ